MGKVVRIYIIMQTLRPYQVDGVSGIYDNWRAGDQGVLYVSPTGTGKTTVAAHITHHLESHSKRILFLAHRDELISQCYNKLESYGLGVDLIHRQNTGSSVAVSTIQSAANRDMGHFDLIIIDEAHRSKAASYQAISERYKNSRFLGLTAFPYRLDGKPLGRASGGIWDSYVRTITPLQAIEQNYLVPISYVCPKVQIDTKGLHKVAGEYNKKEQFSRVNKRSLYEGVAETMQEFGQSSTIVFCLNREHARNTCETLQEYGFRAAYLDSKTPEKERLEIYERVEYRDLDAVCNCEIYVEGIDIPIVDTIVLNLITASKSKYLQMGGRGTRPADGKTKNVIIDMGGNWVKHGYMEQDFDIDLNIPLKPKGDAPLKVCEQCRAIILASSRVCPNCGFVFLVEEKEEKLAKGEFVEFGMGDVKTKKKKAVKIKPYIKIPAHLRKQYRTMSDDELHEFAELKGYKPGWVYRMKNLRGA